ncbi:hypothetical protein G7B40_017785 [Aetokthonos hydrillicola Thurmond2011]|jgi:hypothetical protein|uniref:Uncharacterized protein n=1 Tax=Aetokthonos hydrillicola Thurmond2011 TaxID=2712845 RepID=A0AAP5I7X8_9CYAN|nr:hypothetical protein [Aetokthonos hydrillicola]MBO3458214.1 hypothetical protein [Aetokthonos hydrillicola CCALA 1050]MBW4584434.1 hypothetical protein [Aetokthonos hydrillicola CCALA 1050]MDR9896395.1 hypothetical protein [Aetokthonos hydrillicola Thurmond2011]
MIRILRVKENGQFGTTTFKQAPIDSTDPRLKESDKYVAKEGDLFAFLSIDYDGTDNQGVRHRDHWKVTFKRRLQPKQGEAKQTWFVFRAHVEELEASVVND